MSVTLAARARGFTLVELIITMAILAILLVAAAPSFADFFDRYRVRGAVDDAISVIANARASAVKSNRDVNIAFSGDTANAWCLGANQAALPTAGQRIPAAQPCDCKNAAACQVEGRRLAIDQSKHGTVSANPFNGSFVFNSRLGTVVNAGAITTPANVTFTSPTGKYDLRLDVTALGQARMCVPTTKPAIPGISRCAP